MTISPNANAQQGIDTLTITPDNTQIQFNAKHFGVLNVSGTFKSFSGWLIIQNDIIISAQLKLKTNSIFTDNHSRDKSLKAKEFLNAKGYPHINLGFTDNDHPAIIQAQLKIKRVSNIIPITYRLDPEIQGTQSIQANCKISRTLYSLDLGRMDDLVSDKIDVVVSITLITK
ncbi:MAG: hypothetical protein Roseis2KO_10790 [Roseivirga sp.]